MLKQSAGDEYAQVLLRGGGTKGNKLRVDDKLVPELLDRGVTALTLKGLGKRAQAEVQSFGQAIDDAWRAIPDGQSVQVDDVIARLSKVAEETHMIKDAAGNLLPMGPEARRGVANINKLQDTIANYAEQVKIWDIDNGVEKVMNVIPAEKMRRLRQYFDKVSADAGRFEGSNMASRSTAAAHAEAADAIRSELAKVYPDIAAINKEYSFWKDLAKVSEDTLIRKTGQGKGLGTTMAGIAGQSVGLVQGGVPGLVVGKQSMEALSKAASSTAWRTIDAVAKDRLAKAIAKGSRGEAEAIIRQMQAFVLSAEARKAGDRK